MKTLFLFLTCIGCWAQFPEEMLLSIGQAVSGGGGTPASSLVTNLVAFYSFASSGDVLVDSAGVNTLAAAGSTPAYTDGGKVGGGVTNAGTTGAYKVSAVNSTNNFNGGAMSAACWIKSRNVSGTGCAFSHWNSTDFRRRWYIGHDASAKPYVVYSTNGTAALTYSHSAITFSADTWYHIALTSTTGKWTLYVDGQPVKTNVIGGTLYTPGMEQVAVMQNLTPTYFLGAVDEAGYWSRELTASEVLSLYNAGVAGVTHPFTGY